MNKTNLQKMREKANISLVELSNKTNIPYTTLISYEKRYRNINSIYYTRLKILAKNLKCEIEDILENE